jgi:hypothetical protein
MYIYPTGEVTVTDDFYINSACDGDITISVTLTTDDSGDTVPYKMNTVQLYKNLTDVELAASASYSYDVEFGTTDATTFPANYNHGNILIQYTIYETDDEDSNFDVSWACTATYNIPDGFTNTNPLSTIIQSDNSDCNLSNVTSGTTVIHRYYMAAYTKPSPSVDGNFPTGKFTFTVTNNLSSAVTLSNIITKPAILYYKDASSEKSTNASFSIGGSNYIIGTISGYAKIKNAVANYLDAYESNYPNSHWLVSAAQCDLFAESETATVWTSKIRVSDEVKTYWTGHSDDAGYNIQVTGTKCGEVPDIPSNSYKFTYKFNYPSHSIVITMVAKKSIGLSDLLDIIEGVLFAGYTAYFNDNGVAVISLYWLSTNYVNQPDFYSNPGKYATPIYAGGTSGCETATSNVKAAYLTINDFPSTFTVIDGTPIKFSENFEYPTDGMVASNDVFYYGNKKPNKIIAKGSNIYDMALTISYNKTKGVYVDYDDDVIESSE